MTFSSLTISRPPLIAWLALAMALAAFNPQDLQAKQIVELDQIITIVNDDVITATELERRIHLITQQLKQSRTQLPPAEILRKQILERLILEKIQLQLAGKRAIRIGDETINRMIDNIARENKLSLTAFRTVLERDGVSFAEFRQSIKRDLTIERLKTQEVDKQVNITTQEVNNFLLKSAKQGNSKTEYRLGHILISIPEAATPAQIDEKKTKATQVLNQLRQGDDFAKTAVASSDGQQALQGGELGWLKAGQLPTIFADTILRMKPGEISEPLRSSSGYHIVKLINKRNQGQKSLIEQTMARHILIRTDEVTSDRVAQERLERIRQRIIAGEDFGKLAKAHSDDKASALDGGSLGWVSPGSMVKRFDRAMDALKPGELSQPVRTRFGWHLLQVMSRRQHDNSSEQQRLQARRLIHKRKANEALENWSRRIRDEAYVEYRLNN